MTNWLPLLIVTMPVIWRIGNIGVCIHVEFRSYVLVSRKQPVVSLSTTEVEFIAATSCACQAIWMRRILEKLSHTQGNCTTMFCDNSSTIKLSKNPTMHGRSKHIDVRFHFLRDLTKERVVE